MKRIELDAIDLHILKELQENGRLANVELAGRVGLSPAPCLRRVRALETAGVIQKYVALVNPHAVNLGVTVFVQVTLNLQVEGRLDSFEETIRRRPEVLDCYMMAGAADYLLRVVVADVVEYERFLKEVLTRIDNVASFNSTFALKEAKYSTGLPLPPWEPLQKMSPPPAHAAAPARRRQLFARG
jgi:Lrp/AsnC family leucine-responsive transcriptional regulator